MKPQYSKFVQLASAAVLLICLPATIRGATLYVWQESPSPAPPYTNWTAAAHVIQDAVDVAQTGDTVVVAGGVYATGGRAVGTSLLTNRVAVDRAITVESSMGPQVTIIQGWQVPGVTNGDGAVRCVYLADGAVLSGFTLTDGATRTFPGDYGREQAGGGVWCESTNALVSDCVLIGNCASQYGGAAYRGTLHHCTLSGNAASWGGGAYLSTLNNCTLDGNTATVGDGGGAFGCTLNGSTLSGNSGQYGGGAFGCRLNDCRLEGNVAEYGGGAFGGALERSTVAGNSAEDGGGVWRAILDNCIIKENRAQNGGGAYYSTLNNCTLCSNSSECGGGAYGGTLDHCTVIGNSASLQGGGTQSSTLNNCILYYNKAAIGENHEPSSVLSSCCTVPLPTNGIGNTSADPQLASLSHLSMFSPCIGAGTDAHTIGTDIDGEDWASPPSIGCDEYHAEGLNGPLNVAIGAAHTNLAVGHAVGFQAELVGRPSATAWSFGDGTVLSNRPYASHAWVAPGTYPVVLQAWNDSYPSGVTATVVVEVETRPVHYVALDSANPLPPYNSWTTAARSIQEAVDAAAPGSLVLVADGMYTAGGRAVYRKMTNRVAVVEPVIVKSVNGPGLTAIRGYQVPWTTNGPGAIRCVYLGEGAMLDGFTLTSGATHSSGDYIKEQSGGGVYCESLSAMVSNCVIAGNFARYGGGVRSGTLFNCALTSNSATYDGGAYHGTLNSCTLIGNSATYDGGGAYQGTLSNCTLIGNSANDDGGGAYYGTLNNCALTSNSANDDGGGAYHGTLSSCVLTDNFADSGGGARGSMLTNCTLTGNSAIESGGGARGSTLYNCILYLNSASTGADHSGSTCIDCWTSDPLFVNYAASNLRLQSNSPCINAGNNAYAPGPTDLDGRPRIIGGTVDIGAYEFQGPGMGEFIAWMRLFGLPTDGTADFTDWDADGHTTWQEWQCLTDPTNALSALRLLSASPAGVNVTVSWQSVEGVNYFLERSTNLAGPLPIFARLAIGLAGEAGTTSYTDTNATQLAPLFYRVGVSR